MLLLDAASTQFSGREMTEQRFRGSLKRRIGVAVGLLVVGIALVVVAYKRQMGWGPDGFAHGYYWGLAWGITGGAVGTLIRNIVLLVNAQAFRAQFVRETDERNRMIAARAWQMAAMLTILGIIVATFFLSAALIVPLLYVIAAQCALFALVYLVLQRLG